MVFLHDGRKAGFVSFGRKYSRYKVTHCLLISIFCVTDILGSIMIASMAPRVQYFSTS